MTTKPITFGTVLRYSLLPGVVPRIRDLVGSGFGSFAYFVALVYRAVRLLPDGHAFLNPANVGRFGIVAVVTEAWRHIHFNRKQLRQNNWDQYIAFAVILAAISLLILQFITLAFALFIPGAMAFSFNGGASFATPFQMFDTPALAGMTGDLAKNPQNFYDLSFIFLDRVFGVPNMFNSCIADGVANSCVAIGPMYGADVAKSVNDPASFPWPYHYALQGMFQFYSIGLLVVAIFLLIYFSIVVIVETAQTGTPFGKRFDHVWAPLRLVTAAGLLIPISFGLNAGQYLVLYSAKWGANFASNGWIGFNQTLVKANVDGASTLLGKNGEMIARPNVPDPAELLHFMAVMNACRTIEDDRLTPYARAAGQQYKGYKPEDKVLVKPYIVRAAPKKGDPVFVEMTEMMDYDYAVQFSQYGNVTIRFGIQDEYSGKDQKGTVVPICGEITIPTTFFPGLSGDGVPPGVTAPAYRQEGATVIMRAYWNFMQEMVFKRGASDTYNTIYSPDEATKVVASLPWNVNSQISQSYVNNYFHPIDTVTTLPTNKDYDDLVAYSKARLNTIIYMGQKQEMTNKSGPYQLPADLLVRGWAAAGIWYNRIAEMNGAFTTAAWNLPQVSMYPFTMAYLASEKMKNQVSVSPEDIFSPSVQNEKFPIKWLRGPDEATAAQVYWGITTLMKAKANLTGNIVLDLINTLFGTSGLFSIRENANVHPLAQLSSIGKSLVERSVTLLGGGLLATAISPWLTDQNTAKLRPIVNVISSFAFSMLSIGASAGFILFFVLPLLPFIYFFFAVAGWVKTIFEAMVGVPLWALAHIRIDGKGLPGDAASAGYFLILEIMIRPILIVFGLIASVTIYAAAVNVLNDIFNLAVANVAGLDMDKAMTTAGFSMENVRSSIDTFFYTIMYVIIVYMLGMSSFKLIDLIPKSALRWLGSGATPFQDGGGEAASSQLVSYGTMGSQMAFSQLGGAAKTGVQGMSELAKAMKDRK